MPAIGAGRVFGFEVLCCPVARKADSGVEKDVFLLRRFRPGNTLNRKKVCCDWIASKLQDSGVAVSGIQLRASVA